MIHESSFPLARHLKSNIETLRREEAQLRPKDYVVYPEAGAYLGDWGIYTIYTVRGGWTHAPGIEERARLFPETVELARRFPEIQRLGFSRLGPQTHIFPHRDGDGLDVVRGLLTLRASPGCLMRLDGVVHPFVPGEWMFFRGSDLHEVGNPGPEDRIVLILDVKVADDAYLPTLRDREHPVYSRPVPACT